jgi:pantoate--beta-alanine ligase
MEQARSREDLQRLLAEWRRDGRSLALVPTMGNLHEGHITLVRSACGLADRVVASIYVNPTQFGPGEDYGRYPRTPEADLRKLREAGCDLAFMPADADIYPHGLEDAIRLVAPPSLAGVLEGASRPGHFDGVVSVVARLLTLVRPDLAVFGEKDYQQLLVIRRLVEDLGLAVRIEAVPTVRGPDGLALSSRNRYLDRRQKAAASQLNRVLAGAAAELRMPGGAIEAIERAARDRLTATGMKVDYVAVRRAADLGEAKFGDRPLRVLAAVWCGDTRLIDNFAVD